MDCWLFISIAVFSFTSIPLRKREKLGFGILVLDEVERRCSVNGLNGSYLKYSRFEKRGGLLLFGRGDRTRRERKNPAQGKSRDL